VVKEFSAVRIGPGCNAVSFLCTMDIGEGVFQASYIGLGMMIKDAKRFPDAPGHWGFFSFGHRPPPYESVSAVRPAADAVLHVNLASDTDFVFPGAYRVGTGMTDYEASSALLVPTNLPHPRSPR